MSNELQSIKLASITFRTLKRAKGNKKPTKVLPYLLSAGERFYPRDGFFRKM